MQMIKYPMKNEVFNQDQTKFQEPFKECYLKKNNFNNEIKKKNLE